MSVLGKLPPDELVFAWEPLIEILQKDSKRLADLFFAHWQEVGVHKDEMPLAPDWKRFLQLNAAGIVRIWTARDDRDLDLKGYLAWYVQPHIDYCLTLTAEMGPYYLAEEARKGMAGIKMFRTCIEALKAMGVKRLVGHSRLGRLDVIFKRIGFAPLDQTWDMLL